ncbi:hypothetical protein [Streptomyces sp. H34-S4]|uniref:hypothetical protein n=1 Tax=Streptomyces sp. H34-S4 TaxID=2996463 RepID=UPI00226F4643|nr:hypothetical protein [Streptomyces sp. H34-S4]MCY0939215.1 hypothetical protein [Streptomyces sp. H34-S4]
MNGLEWRNATTVELNPGFEVADADDRRVDTLRDVRVACEGGFLHLDIPGTKEIQLVSAPAVHRVSYRPDDS